MIEPVEIDEIAIGGLDALASKTEPDLAEERRPHRLQMPMTAPPVGPKLRHGHCRGERCARSRGGRNCGIERCPIKGSGVSQRGGSGWGFLRAGGPYPGGRWLVNTPSHSRPAGTRWALGLP